MSTEVIEYGAAASALERMPKDLALLKMENDTCMSMAAARPRDWNLIKKDLDEQLEAFPEMAIASVYVKPVGLSDDTCLDCGNTMKRYRNSQPKKRCDKCGEQRIDPGRMQYATGLSIRAAETLAEVCGYNRIYADVEIIDQNTVKVTATYTDFQRGRIYRDVSLVSRIFKKYNGQTEVKADDRFYGMDIPAAKSRVIREAVNRSLPAGVKAWFRERCDAISEGLASKETLTKALAAWQAIGVTEQQLEGVTSLPSKNWKSREFAMLRTMYMQIKNNEETVESLFSVGEQEPSARPENGGGKVTGSALSNPQASKQPLPERGGKPASKPPTAPAKQPPKETEPAKQEKPPESRASTPKWKSVLLERLAKCETAAEVWTVGEAIEKSFPLAGMEADDLQQICTDRWNDLDAAAQAAADQPVVDDESAQEQPDEESQGEADDDGSQEVPDEPPPQKRGRGRPPGAKNQRSML